MKLNLDALRFRMGKNSVSGAEYLAHWTTLLPSGQVTRECRVWQGSTNGWHGGYFGQLTVRVNGKVKKLYVHRLALWLKLNPKRKGVCELPDVLPLARQTCGNNRCIEFSHLERKTNAKA